ncbi:MAG: hypothetical protein CR982_02465 [Candidatus Cloacimonadota bacterium]|nr:MAG: hypothetical protein CR982_02465 [Candidatus Cloacimonadota bacterium]PIE78533.1 MAG: hypothetical protein CSA15_07515 [Candidatus Delongbacteria bacterium]
MEFLSLFDNYYIVAIFGALFGSFLNVVIYRVPIGRSISFPPSSCTDCGARIKFYDNIPIISYLFLRGKCRSCKSHISIRYPLVEFTHMVIYLILYKALGFSLTLLVALPFTSILFAISVIDLETFTIPVKLQIALITTSIIGFILNYFFNIVNLTPLEMILGGVVGFSIPFLIGVIGKIILKQMAMGGGDIFLLAYGGILIGWKNTILSFFIASLLGVIFYSIPAIIENFKKNSNTISLSNKIKLRDRFLDLLLNYKLKGEKIEYKPSSFEEELTLFFFYYMTDTGRKGDSILKDLKGGTVKEIESVLSKDLVGYSDFNENLKFLKEKSKKVNPKLFELLSTIEPRTVNMIPLKELKANIENLEVDKLLELHRAYQYSGNSVEQNYIEEYFVKNHFDNNSILESMAYDFYSDQYLRKFNQYNTILESRENNLDSYYYKLIIYKLYFYRRRLPLGPYLSIGMVLTLVWGEQLIRWYLSIILP